MASSKVKTTITLPETIKKFAQVYGIQNDLTLGEVIEKALTELLVKKS